MMGRRFAPGRSRAGATTMKAISAKMEKPPAITSNRPHLARSSSAPLSAPGNDLVLAEHHRLGEYSPHARKQAVRHAAAMIIVRGSQRFVDLGGYRRSYRSRRMLAVVKDGPHHPPIFLERHRF